jgi:FkbM family methyltransferase
MNLDEVLKSDKKVKTISFEEDIVIYGAGNFGRLCVSILKKEGYKVICFVDKDKYKYQEYIDDIKVLSIKSEELQAKKNNLICVMGIFNAYVDLAIIEKELLLSFKEVINPLSFYDLFCEEIGDYFWLSKKDNYLKNRYMISKAYESFEDEYSKELFENILKYRFSNDLNTIYKPQNVKTQYFPEDINCVYPSLKFLDCGAYNGDTILKILDNNMSISSYIGFEPDIQNVKLLSKNLRNKIKIESYIYPCGVWNETDKLRFNGGTGSSSHIDSMGNDIINVVSIDEVIINKDVNFVKMDIEGAEVEALNGAKELISKYEPILAISAYHKYDDLWTILETINSFNVEYKYFMRMYEYNGFGIVYYAIPKKYLKNKG